MSELPKGWVETTLGEVVETNTSSIKKNYKHNEIYYLDTGSITLGKIDSLQLLLLKDAPSRAKRLVKNNSIVYSTVRPIQRHYGVIINPAVNLVVSTGFTVIDSIENKSNNIFIYYFLTANKIVKKLDMIANGTVSTYPSIKPIDIESLSINLPPLPEQKSIANILSVFDEKIELLRKQNETLETIAQRVFKEWFINFKYPDATGEMIDSELGEIPKEWRVYELIELVNIVNGYSYIGKELVESSDEALVTLKSFNRNGGFQTRGFKPFSGNPKPQQEVSIGDLIVAHTDLTQDAEVLGNPAFVFEDGGFNKMFITMDLVKVNSNIEHIDNAFLYYVMKDRSFKGHCIGYSNGTTVLHLSKKAIPEYRLVLPEDLSLAKDFSDMAYSMTRKISNNISQIQTLTKTRDTLLPKLVSGGIRVEGLGS